jgi:hypothetical protein
MTKEFKEIIAPFLFEGKEYCPQFCQFVDGWPTIKYKADRWHPEEKVKVSNENVQVVSYDDNSITVLAGNEQQGFYLITITELEGKAIVECCKKTPIIHQFQQPHEQQIINLFHEIKIGERVFTKSALVWQMELHMALKNEDYKKAAEIRDAMTKAGIQNGKTLR